MFNSQKSNFQQIILRKKCNSLHQVKKKISRDLQDQQQFQHLTSVRPPSKRTHKKNINFDGLIQYTIQVIKTLFVDNHYQIGENMINFISNNLDKMKTKIQQRLSLLKYMQQNLINRSFIEVESEIKRQWKKNVLFYSLNMIWCATLINQQPKQLKIFIKNYESLRNLIANISNFYFYNALQKKQNSFEIILEQTSHEIINCTKDWNKIYIDIFLPLITQNIDINFLIDFKSLQINPDYLDCHNPRQQLSDTSFIISKIANQTTVFGKIQLIKQFRKSFQKQIQINANMIAEQKKNKQPSILQKQDVIGCTIYAIVQSKSQNIAKSIKALSLLLNKQRSILTKKGVDSYFTDLQSACEYLSSNDCISNLITMPNKVILK